MFAELKRAGIAFVFSTHDIGQARRVADRVAIFGKGRIVEQGPAERTIASPQTKEARAFIAGNLPW